MWKDRELATEASDVLLIAVPVASAAALVSLGIADGSAREVIEDGVVMAGALILADAVTMALKHGTARLRPHAWAAGGSSVEGDLQSFVSAHTSRAFVAAAVATQVTRLRGRPGWKWVAALGFTAAAATGWLRIAGDHHWATDVLGGALVGTAAGLGVASVALRPVDAPRSSFAVAPAPGGIAVLF